MEKYFKTIMLFFCAVLLGTAVQVVAVQAKEAKGIWEFLYFNWEGQEHTLGYQWNEGSLPPTFQYQVCRIYFKGEELVEEELDFGTMNGNSLMTLPDYLGDGKDGIVIATRLGSTGHLSYGVYKLVSGKLEQVPPGRSVSHGTLAYKDGWLTEWAGVTSAVIHYRNGRLVSEPKLIFESTQVRGVIRFNIAKNGEITAWWARAIYKEKKFIEQKRQRLQNGAEIELPLKKNLLLIREGDKSPDAEAILIEDGNILQVFLPNTLYANAKGVTSMTIGLSVNDGDRISLKCPFEVQVRVTE